MKRRERHQTGHIYAASDSFYVRYWTTEITEGQPKRVQRSEWLCNKDAQHFSATSKPVKQKRDEVMAKINAAKPGANDGVTVPAFWAGVYLPFAEKNLAHSTRQGYNQIWSQHLAGHFGETKLCDYTTGMASRFLTALAEKYSRRTLNHIRSCASAVFSHALNLEYVDANAWHGAKALGKIRDTEGTAHYTLEEAENIISALVDHVDAQLAFALAFFLGLRPSEIAGLQWGDVDGSYLHIRRAYVRGEVGPTKTPESVAALPIIQPIAGLLALWRPECPTTGEGWMFPNERNRPRDFRDFTQKVMRPAVQAKGLIWKGLYAGRRGAGTMLVELTGNLVAAQELLRHKSLTTTAMFYKKRTQSALVSGMKLLEAATLEKT